MRTECPKCGSLSARYVKDRTDIILRCLCGLHKVVHSTLETMEIEHRDIGKNIILPRANTRLWHCFMSLVALKQGSTREVGDVMNSSTGTVNTMSEVSSQLTVLRYKGLVEVVDNRKGLVGGSTWVLTEKSKALTENL